MLKKKSNDKLTKFEHVQEMTSKMLDGMKNLKAKYDDLDPKTKKKLMAGVAGLTALLVGAATVKKIRKKK